MFRQGWSEHKAPDGSVYYYNELTQESTFDRPEALMSNVERKLPRTSWRVYKRDGKAYFFNSKTNESQWEEPMEYTRYIERLRALCAGDAPTKDMESLELYNTARTKLEEELAYEEQQEYQEDRRKRRKKTLDEMRDEISKEFVVIEDDYFKHGNKNDDDGVDTFLEMLKDRKVGLDADWITALQKHGIANDKRFQQLEGLERKQAALEQYKKAMLHPLLEEMVAKKEIDSRMSTKKVMGKLGIDKNLEQQVRGFLDALYDTEKKAKAEEKLVFVRALYDTIPDYDFMLAKSKCPEFKYLSDRDLEKIRFRKWYRHQALLKKHKEIELPSRDQQDLADKVLDDLHDLKKSLRKKLKKHNKEDYPSVIAQEKLLEDEIEPIKQLIIERL